ncbi:MAG: hypothetical protein M1833_006008 [Piccolia ochrophora]|nr:MAG: hypothetical protein M1833_006008 [Piccolia ochrophora]
MPEPPPPPVSLVLLPSVTLPSSHDSFEAAYGSALTSAIADTSSMLNRSSKAAILEIAVVCSHLHPEREGPREQIYDLTQNLLAGLYRLVCLICARDGVEVEGQGGVDARVLLVNAKSSPHTTLSPKEFQQGPVINLGTLAASKRLWTVIFSMDSEAGNLLWETFATATTAADATLPNRKTVGAETDQALSEGVERVPLELGVNQHRHRSVAVGGTFDHLHAGHKLLLTMTAFLLEPSNDGEGKERCLTIGISGDELLKSKQFRTFLGSWEERQAEVSEFMQSILDFRDRSEVFKAPEKTLSGSGERTVSAELPHGLVLQYVELSDPYGPTVTDESISALVISAETRSGGSAINSKRQEKGFRALKVYEVDVLNARGDNAGKDDGTAEESFDSKISSTQIRRRMAEKNASQTAAG